MIKDFTNNYHKVIHYKYKNILDRYINILSRAIIYGQTVRQAAQKHKHRYYVRKRLKRRKHMIKEKVKFLSNLDYL